MFRYLAEQWRAAARLPDGRVFGLEVLRAFAILEVLTTHAAPLLRRQWPAYPWLRLPDGVDVFFALSGLLVGRILYRTLQRQARLYPADALRFLRRRWARTTPMYYLTLGLMAAGVGAGLLPGDAAQISPAFWLFLQNFAWPFHDFFWESWSMPVQEWFYVLLAAALALLSMPSRLSADARYLTAVLALLIVPVCLRAYMAPTEGLDAFWWDVRVRKVVLFRLDAIAWGALAGWGCARFPATMGRLRWACLAAGLALLYWPTSDERDFAGDYYRIWYHVQHGAGFALLLPVFAFWRRRPDGLPARVVLRTSRISYSLYLLHFGLLLLPLTAWPGGKAWPTLLLAAGYFACAYGLAFLCYVFVERPPIAWERRLRGGGIR